MLELEPCADVIVSGAARRSILVGGDAGWAAAKRIFFKGFRKNVISSKFSNDIGGAPTNYRRRRADQQKSAAAPTNWRRRRTTPFIHVIVQFDH